MRPFLLCVTSMMIIAGCVQSHTGRYGRKALRVDEPIYDVRAVKMLDSTVKLTFIGTPTLRTAGRNVGWVEVVIGPSPEDMNDTLVFSISLAGSATPGESVQLVGEADWQTRAAKHATRACMEVHVVAGDVDHLYYELEKEFEQADPMDLTPFTMAVSDSQIDVGVTARRIFVPPGEYLPTSENFRIVISDAQLKVVYRSDYGQSFLQFVGLVEPQGVGQMQRFAIPWFGRDMNGQRVPDGKYTAELIIPAVPRPYRTTCEVPWPPK